MSHAVALVLRALSAVLIDAYEHINDCLPKLIVSSYSNTFFERCIVSSQDMYYVRVFIFLHPIFAVAVTTRRLHLQNSDCTHA